MHKPCPDKSQDETQAKSGKLNNSLKCEPKFPRYIYLFRLPDWCAMWIPQSCLRRLDVEQAPKEGLPFSLRGGFLQSPCLYRLCSYRLLTLPEFITTHSLQVATLILASHISTILLYWESVNPCHVDIVLYGRPWKTFNKFDSKTHIFVIIWHNMRIM